MSALKVETDGYDTLAETWYRISEFTATLANSQDRRRDHFGRDRPADYFHQYMQVIAHVIDDHGNDVADYFIEFLNGADLVGQQASEFFHTEVLEIVKQNSMNPSFLPALI